MSSLHPDHLRAEGAESVTGTGSTLTRARGTSRKLAAVKVTSVPTPRPGKMQSRGSGRTTAGGSAAKVATAKAAGAARAAAVAKGAAKAAAVAQVAATRAAAARGAKASAAAKKPAVAKPVADKLVAPTPVADKPVAKPVVAAAADAPKAVAPKAAAPEAVAPAVRPTPHKRTVVTEPVVLAPVVLEPVAVAPVAVEKSRVPVIDVVDASDVVTSLAEGRRRFLRHPSQGRRRPALYLAAALVGAISVGGFTSGDPAAHATAPVSHSVSVAQELGIESVPDDEVIALDATRGLAELAASRSDRDAQQAAAAQAQADADKKAAAAAAAAAEAARPKAVLPVQGARLTSGFGARWGSLHAGIDLAAPMRTPEMAAMDGVVLKAGPASGYGLAVYIQHANGDVTVYGHMDEILVAPGQVVKAGETIALLGNRGQSTGPHLHFEVRVGGMNGQKIDPIPWLRERGVNI